MSFEDCFKDVSARDFLSRNRASLQSGQAWQGEPAKDAAAALQAIHRAEHPEMESQATNLTKHGLFKQKTSASEPPVTLGQKKGQGQGL